MFLWEIVMCDMNNLPITELQHRILRLLINIEYGNTNNYSTQEYKHNIVNMIIPKNWLNYYVLIYDDMKKTYHNHDIEDYIYHDI